MAETREQHVMRLSRGKTPHISAGRLQDHLENWELAGIRKKVGWVKDWRREVHRIACRGGTARRNHGALCDTDETRHYYVVYVEMA